MTHHTDADSAEFEKAWRERPIYMGGFHQKEVAYIWWMQAARRAPAAPVPQEPKQWAPEEIEAGCMGIRWVSNEGIHGRPTDHDVREYLLRTPTACGCHCEECREFYAAAPQPPECLKRENPATKPEAAPVPQGLFEAIEHGDEKHRAWLKAALTAFFAGKPVPLEVAAATQPPEAAQSNSAEIDGIEKAAAPVQLPEPVAFVHTPAFVWNGNISPVVSFAKYEDDYKSGIYSLRTPLYTEQQVRDLLAAHGIGKGNG